MRVPDNLLLPERYDSISWNRMGQAKTDINDVAVGGIVGSERYPHMPRVVIPAPSTGYPG